jgi:hypothetical protein
MSKRDREKRRQRSRERQDGAKQVSGRRSGFGVLDLKKANDEADWFKPKKASYLINLVPFVVGSDILEKLRDPDGNIIGIRKGDEEYKLEVPVHTRLGPENKSCLCRLLAFGLDCFICEQKVGLSWEKDERMIRDHTPQWRDMYNIQVLEPSGHEEKIYLWDVAYKSFESEMLDELKEVEIDEGRKIYVGGVEDDISSVRFRGIDKTMVNAKGDVISFVGFKSFKFMERDDELDEDLLELVHPLDEMLIIPADYDVVKNLYLGVDPEGDEEGEPDKEKDDKQPSDEDEDTQETGELTWDGLDDMDIDQMLAFMEQEGLKIRGAPRMKERKLRKALREEQPEEEKEPEEEKGENTCPFDHVFGVECDKFKDCDKCDIWQECAKAQQEMNK